MTAPRHLCQALLNGPATPADLAAAEELLRSALSEPEPGLADQDGFGASWNPPAIPETSESRQFALTALAPTLLLDGIWLARVAQPANAHRDSESRLFDLYCRIVGLSDPALSPPSRFRAKLITEGIHLPPLDSPSFFQSAAIPDFALEFPALHLALLHRPRMYFPELLGYTLAHVLREPAWWDAPLPGDSTYGNEIRALAQAALEAYPRKEAHDARIRGGWRIYRHGFDTLARGIEGWLSREHTTEQAMGDLLRAKRSHAIGYHGRVKLQGRGLDEWLADGAGDPGPLLDALRGSPHVDGARPAASRLIRAMDFGGPMFGVFDERERRICLEWIKGTEALGCAAQAIPTMRPGDACPETPPLPAPGLGKRRLFTALLRGESPADCPPETDLAIRRVLRRAHWLSPLQRGRRRCFAYTPERFYAHIDAMHRREVDRYRPGSGPPKISREYCRWAITQLAPAILVDGCWLAGVGTAAENLGEIGRHLLKIYADELGEGRPAWNHPNVYRRLLESLEIDLPPLASDEFAASSLFLDAAFDIPVYLLAIGLRAHRYFPELLGLNLAIELSGLGAGYMRTLDILRHHRIDPAIVQLHLSIDNLASGHAARARETITLFLDDTRRREGADVVQTQWRRIWTGYLSLHGAASGLAVGFAARYFRERFGSLKASPGVSG